MEKNFTHLGWVRFLGFLLGICFFMMPGLVFGQIAAWDLTGAAGNETTFNSTTTNSNLNTSVLSRGSGITATSLADGYSSNGFSTTATTLANAVTANNYYQFTINAKSGYKVSLSTLDIKIRRSGSTAPSTFQWRYSLDGFTTPINIGSSFTNTGTTSSGNSQTQIDLSSISALQNVNNSTTVTFRLYCWNGTSSTATVAVGKSATSSALAIGGTVESASTPTKLVITSINPTDPTVGSGFNVTVQSQDGSSIASNVTATTGFTLTTNGNAGTIGGTTTGSITAGSNSVTVSGVTLSSSGTGVTLTATQTSGDALTAGTSATFSVLAAASQLAFGTSPPATGSVGVNLTSFTVEARRPDNSVDNTYTGNITISKASGSGTLSGTTSVAAVAGVATFSTLQLSAADTYTLTGSASGLTDITSGNIVVSIANTTAILWSSAGNTAWLTSGNWSGSAVPSSTQVAQFGVNPTPGTNIGLNTGSTRTYAGIEITSDRLLALTLGNSGSNNGSGAIQLNGGIINSESNVIIRNNCSNTFTLQDLQGSTNSVLGLILGNTTENIINISGTGGITISSIISGTSKNLTKSGSGSGNLTLSGTNTYTGVTTINAGTLSVATIENGGVAGNLGQATNAAANFVLGGGTLKYTGATSSTDRNYTLTSVTTSTIDVTTNTLTISGASTNTTGALTKAGSGTLILTGGNLYTGLTTVSLGTLQLNKSGGTTIPITNNVNVTGGTLQISSNQTLNNLTVNGGDVTVDDGVTLTINGTLTLTSGKITLGTGNVVASAISGGSASSYVVTAGTGKLTINAVSSATFPIGPTPSNYNPVAISSGGGSNYAVNVSSTAPTGSGITQPGAAIKRQWDITPSGSPTNVSLTFQYNDNEGVLGSFLPTSSMDGIHFNGTTWNYIGSAMGMGASPYNVTFTYAGPTWSPFSFGNAGVLPTELINLSAKSKNSQNLITWQTATERNSDHFDIQRATNPQAHWQTIGTVKAAGNSQTIKAYEYMDNTPLSINYYRLRSVDFDGKENLSNTVSVINNNKSGTLKVYPTIANDKINIISDSNEPQIFNIYNLLGQNVQTGQIIGQKELIISPLSKGTYFLKVQGETVKFVKN
jgi:autotransporter-associated beta strand protein